MNSPKILIILIEYCWFFAFHKGGDEPLGSQVPSMFFNFIGSDIDWKYNTEPEKNACLSSPEQRYRKNITGNNFERKHTWNKWIIKVKMFFFQYLGVIGQEEKC